MKRTPHGVVTTAVITATFGVVGLMSRPASGQLPPVPGGPEFAAPQQENEDGPEIFTRGPLHEAFATPNSTEPVEGLLVAKAAPEPIDEVPPDQQPEGENVIWVPGYWAWDADLEDYIWVSGVWRDVPPGRRWVPGYWAPVDGGHRWVAGMWVTDSTDELAYLPAPPPSQERGPTVEAPSEDHFWTPGYWDYFDAGYHWRPGYWAPVQESWIWIPPRYCHTPFGYVFVPGYWDYVMDARGVVFAPVRFHQVPVVYTPVVVVNTWQNFWLHLFVNPRHNAYWFGDYYGPRYASAGFVPWFDYHGRGRGYDSLFVYYNWRYGSDFSRRLRGWNQYYTAHPDLRPRHTWRDQRAFVERHRDQPNVVQNVAITLNEAVRTKVAPVGFTSLTRDRRHAIERDVRSFRDFNHERTRVADRGRTDGDRDRDRDGRPGRGPSLRIPQITQLEGRRTQTNAPTGPPASRPDGRDGRPGGPDGRRDGFDRDRDGRGGTGRDRDGSDGDRGNVFDRTPGRDRDLPRPGPVGPRPDDRTPGATRPGTPRPDGVRPDDDRPRDGRPGQPPRPGEARPGPTPGATLPGTRPSSPDRPDGRSDDRRDNRPGVGTPRSDVPATRPGLPGSTPGRRPDIRGQSPDVDSPRPDNRPGLLPTQPRPLPTEPRTQPAQPRTQPAQPGRTVPGLTPPRTTESARPDSRPGAQPTQPRPQPGATPRSLPPSTQPGATRSLPPSTRPQTTPRPDSQPRLQPRTDTPRATPGATPAPSQPRPSIPQFNRPNPIQPRTQPTQPRSVIPPSSRPTPQAPAIAPRVQPPPSAPRIQTPSPRPQPRAQPAPRPQQPRVQPAPQSPRPSLRAPGGGGGRPPAAPGGGRGGSRDRNEGKGRR